jgi:hypothetical protein
MALGWKEPFQLGLKQKFCFSRKKLTKSYKNFHENFRENKNSCEKWRGKQKYRKKSKFQEANEVFKSWRNAVDQRIRVMFKNKWEKPCKIIV